MHESSQAVSPVCPAINTYLSLTCTAEPYTLDIEGKSCGLPMETANHLDQVNRFPGWKLHPLKGDLKEFWSLTVTGNWRLVFHYEKEIDSAREIDLIDYH